MQSVAVLGLGVIALTTGAFISASEAAARGSYFEAAVMGATAARPSGDAAFGTVGDSIAGVAAFTITLGAGDSSGAILFTNLGGGEPQRVDGSPDSLIFKRKKGSSLSAGWRTSESSGLSAKCGHGSVGGREDSSSCDPERDLRPTRMARSGRGLALFLTPSDDAWREPKRSV